MNALEKWIAENPDQWYKKDFVWHDDAGNIFILPTEDDPDLNFIEDRDYENNWLDYFPEDGEEIFLDYLPGPTPEFLYKRMAAWSNRPTKISGWQVRTQEEYDKIKSDACTICRPHSGCNAGRRGKGRKHPSWKEKGKTQYK